MSRPSMKQINTWKEELQGIVQMSKEEEELVPKGQKEKLQKLAQKVGASTRGIGYHPDGNPFGYDASIAELIDNIHKALQTLTFIKNCEYARRAVYIAMVAVIASVLFSIISTSVAMKANRISSASLKNTYIPWLQITSLKASMLDPNRVEIVHGCKNYTNAPALDLKIKYSVSNASIVGESPKYVSNPLMPNYEGNFNCIFTGPNQAKHS